MACSSSSGTNATPDSGEKAGDVLIADQYNNRVIEIDHTGKIVWTFGDGSATAGPTSVVGPNDAERLADGTTLIAGTGLPMGAIPACTATTGCQDDRVLLVSPAGKILWQYGQAGVAGAGSNQLSAPVAARMLANGNVLVTDQGNARVIELSMSGGSIVWQYGTTGTTGSGTNQLNNPNSAERLANGNTVIADEANNRVIEVTNAGTIAWQYPQTPDPNLLNGAGFASRLPNGNTLIADSGNSRAIEVTPTGTVAWSYVTNLRTGSNQAPLPSHAVRLANGDTLISDQVNEQVIEVNQSGSIDFSYGQLNTPGNADGQLNWPYDAKVTGDFTGLSMP
jgi:outer membrane protein assembly factor BamB